MNIHEYQAKALLAKFGVPLLKGGVAYTRTRRWTWPASWAARSSCVKAQIHAGGRGKGTFKDDPNGKGGVRVAKSIEEVGANAAAMLGHDLVTKQTGPAGKAVKRLYIEEGCDIKRELYLVACWSTARIGRVAIIASTEGGMDIEEVAHDHPEKIVEQGDRPGRRLPGLSRAARSPSRSASPASRSAAFVKPDGRPLQGLHRARLLADRDQSAGRRRRRAT